MTRSTKLFLLTTICSTITYYSTPIQAIPTSPGSQQLSASGGGNFIQTYAQEEALIEAEIESEEQRQARWDTAVVKSKPQWIRVKDGKEAKGGQSLTKSSCKASLGSESSSKAQSETQSQSQTQTEVEYELEMRGEKVYDDTFATEIIRFLSPGNFYEPQTNSSSSPDGTNLAIEDEKHYFVLVGTNSGKIYGFSPRNVDASYTYFATVKHSTDTGTNTDPRLLIQDIQIDQSNQIVFVVVGDEIYAQRFQVKSTKQQYVISGEPSSNSNETEYLIQIIPLWKSPLKVYTASSPSNSIGLITSITLDTPNKSLYAADNENKQILHIDYSMLCQQLEMPESLPEQPATDTTSTSINNSTSSDNSTTNNQTAQGNLTDQIVTQLEQSPNHGLPGWTLKIQDDAASNVKSNALNDIGSLSLQAQSYGSSERKLFWSSLSQGEQIGTVHSVTLNDETDSTSILIPDTLANNDSGSEGIAYISPNLYYLSSSTKVYVVPQAASLPSSPSDNQPITLYDQLNKGVGPNGIHSVGKSNLLLINDMVSGLLVLKVDEQDGTTLNQTSGITYPQYLSLPLEAGEKINAFTVIVLGALNGFMVGTATLILATFYIFSF